MIPKIIHLCWLSGDEYPELIQRCIDSWKVHLPDYEICLWDTKRFDVNSTLWTKQAYDSKKYAFAADYIRLFALYNYGGIYLDSDILVYKSFDDLLDLPYFVGLDYSTGFEAAVIGAEKHTSWIGYLLNYYENRSFIKNNGDLDTYELPNIFYDELKKKYKFWKVNNINDFNHDDSVLNVFHQDFFNSRDSIGVRKTKRSYCAHNFAGSWTKRKRGLKYYIIKHFPKWIVRSYFYITHHTIKLKMMKEKAPKFVN